MLLFLADLVSAMRTSLSWRPKDEADEVHEVNERRSVPYHGRFIGHVHQKLIWRTVRL